jgi:hypothetical protein
MAIVPIFGYSPERCLGVYGASVRELLRFELDLDAIDSVSGLWRFYVRDGDTAVRQPPSRQLFHQ